MKKREERSILWFREIGREDVPLVGGKGASLGEMLVNLPDVPVPDGFAVTTNAYRLVLRETGLDSFIRETLADLDTSDIKNLQERGRKIREAILNAKMPPGLVSKIEDAYTKLCREAGVTDVDTAVRSSATAEDTVDASFAGQQETYLNVRGSKNVVRAVQECFASLFTDRAISYRVDKNFSHLDTYISAAVQLMVRSDLACAGVIFTLDTESGFRNVVYINASYGLGEFVVQGTVNPDSYYVFKVTGKVVDKKLGLKDRKLVYARDGGTVEKPVPPSHRNRFVLSDKEAEQLASWAMEIEKHYGMPMDIEWAKDGRTGHLYILQARPETVHATKSGNVLVTYKLKKKGKIILDGEAVGEKIGQGRANVIASVKEIGRFKGGEVLITSSTNPDWEPIMKKASAIVTDTGGRTCHAAIVSRELGIPCIIGTENGSQMIKQGSDVTVDCSEGRGLVYEGLLDYEVRYSEIEKMPRTRTHIMVNAGIPELAFTQGQLPHNGVGLAREEFIINSHIQIHPQALLDYRKLVRFVKEGYKKEIEKIRKSGKDPEKEEEIIERRDYYEGVIETIDRLTQGYRDKAQYFIDKLAYGIARIAVGFHPHDVIVRLSDFKTNEYANLIGGRYYEPEESNPMIGYRGASRYYSPQFREAFALECKALHKVRSEMGLKNVLAMVPFCRTPEEARKVINLMEKNGLRQGEDGFQVYVMCEIPSNVILAEEFADIFDGFSIGSNDLTQLTLGLDRDSQHVSHLFDERHSAVKKMLSRVVRAARRKKRKIGICGQAPSDWPSIAAFLVKERISSMSLNPDTVVKTRAFVYAVEWALRNKKDIFTMTEKEIRSIPGLQDPLKMTIHTFEWKMGKRMEKTHVSHKPLSEYVISMKSQES
ncbi:MAG: phosphoenolpyruvate synthase [Thermoplasmata archaeon]